MVMSGKKNVACIFFPKDVKNDTFLVEVYHGTLTTFCDIENIDKAIETCKNALKEYLGIDEITNCKGHPIEFFPLFEGISSEDIIPNNYWFIVTENMGTSSFKSLKSALDHFNERFTFYVKHRSSLTDPYEYKVGRLVTDYNNLKKTAKISCNLPKGTEFTLSFEALRIY